ncbi:MAG: hypothetical protein JRN58_09955 [Nitrososphaerota archaeon]|nr:hypothetical protein [Nitrososphaerota archaeon]MDG6979390.1 hypothetical protein [Nitrososphaerota archaeon]
MEKALVALPDEAWAIIDSKLKGKPGIGRSDIVRAIVLIYLSDQGYMQAVKGTKEAKGPGR